MFSGFPHFKFAVNMFGGVGRPPCPKSRQMQYVLPSSERRLVAKISPQQLLRAHRLSLQLLARLRQADGSISLSHLEVHRRWAQTVGTVRWDVPQRSDAGQLGTSSYDLTLKLEESPLQSNKLVYAKKGKRRHGRSIS